MRAAKNKNPKPRTYTVQQVVAMTNLGEWKVNQLITLGRLRSIKIGGRRLVYAYSVDELIPENAA